MATVASSANSIDVPSLVSQLMALERQPIDKLNTKVSSYQTKISSLGTISGLVSGFQSAIQTLNKNLQGYSATSSDSSIFTASANSTTVSGTYSLNVTKL
ncbi:MAG: flagellar cap protein FliD N-terminal domain-containing protein, partial [Sulfurimicrobium sp.]|nr:flagellar cap protein FliD N-terminal domain-containing protein [Sulfurimicrobium sp.]